MQTKHYVYIGLAALGGFVIWRRFLKTRWQSGNVLDSSTSKKTGVIKENGAILFIKDSEGKAIAKLEAPAPNVRALPKVLKYPAGTEINILGTEKFSETTSIGIAGGAIRMNVEFYKINDTTYVKASDVTLK